MRKLLLTLALGVGIATGTYANETITIGASPVPHAEMLKFVKPTLAKQGYDLKITEFSDYITPNLAVIQKQLDANFFQHQPYLDQYNKDHGSNLVALVKVHLEPMGIYADKATEAKFATSKKATDITKGAKIGVPNDPTNEGRALNILQANGILKIKAGVPYPTKKDIAANPYNVQIIELDPAMLPRSLKGSQINLAVINSNIAMQSGMKPTRDAVILESKDSPFANLIAVRPDEVNQPKMKALAKAMTSPEMKKFIEQKYDGAVIPAF
ncbi:MetQ/NlpA family ABC transporter substrate-binding protein [Aquella oligotrophica]|uniref:Lipoprotein n=1 Tax=Aquella oligotrophica TaxID=2067065 RepID=A0A2I7N6Z5_9NEIS|nr:MetQ/NlpA family ABC transporter substrate-binding protein [Aquella oligotrophica]AUR52246.1 methionine ABC transporter substrate-binding protein [Aquella oligotrophica]